MSGFIMISLIILVFVIIYQIGKASEYAAILRGEKKVNAQVNRAIAFLLVAMFVLGLWGIWECHMYFKDMMLPVAACKTGERYDAMFNTTLVVTGIVFLLTQAILFWFCFKYQASDKRTTYFFAHSNKLELIWTTIPAIAMAVLVGIGLRNWYEVTSPAPAEATVIEIVGKQFNWLIRYPGKDNELGKRDFRKINDATNVLGLDWSDPHNSDDIIAQNGEMHVVVGKPVKLVIGSRDVIHDVGLPHFRMKMDAVPGITTTLWFTPTITSDSMKLITKNPNFVYEIACDQLCGKGHYAMRGTIIVETQAQYDKWMASQSSYYATANPAAAPAAPAADAKDAPAADSTKVISMK
jgi:cytochrome c oxidase subunit 2